VSILRVYDAKGVLRYRIGGPEEEMRALGANSTTTRGQLGWRCDLFNNAMRVATCRRGVWRDYAERQNGAKP
jgi:hypothetical protein